MSEMNSLQIKILKKKNYYMPSKRTRIVAGFVLDVAVTSITVEFDVFVVLVGDSVVVIVVIVFVIVGVVVVGISCGGGGAVGSGSDNDGGSGGMSR